MEVIGTLECMLFIQKKWKIQKKRGQTWLTLMTFLLWISPSLGNDKPLDCRAQDPAFCSSPCIYVKDRCNENRECIMDLCSYLYFQPSLRDLERCWNLPLVCQDEFRYLNKRGVLNKNIAYLLLKLHPFLNQTSQFGFLTSGRFRRISGSFGTELLGKRSNNTPIGARSSGIDNKTPFKPKPTPQFYNLPLDKLTKFKILKKGDDDVQQELTDSRKKRLSVRGNKKIILGSEFLGKRGFQQSERIRRLSGTELLGKRNENPFDASEFLGKRLTSSFAGHLPGKNQNEPASGTELLGKKSSQESSTELRFRRFENEPLGKRIAEKELSELKSQKELGLIRDDPESELWSDYSYL